ncbi:MAG: hypothetical protein LBF97_01065 [Elusimicrobiota bacterium]|jgi:hypothetical protein|nr:hypothetical protein [Elusimicrobiota bacterium]
MWLIFIFLGFIFLYFSKLDKKDKSNNKKVYNFQVLSNKENKNKFVSKTCKLFSLQNKITDFERNLSLETEKNFFYSLNIPKTAPKNLYDSIQIFYALQLLLYLSAKTKFNLEFFLKNIQKSKTKIVLNFYDNKRFEFYFDEILYSKITKIIDTILEIKYKNIHNNELFLKNDFYESNKCQHCFFYTSC